MMSCGFITFVTATNIGLSRVSGCVFVQMAASRLRTQNCLTENTTTKISVGSVADPPQAWAGVLWILLYSEFLLGTLKSVFLLVSDLV